MILVWQRCWFWNYVRFAIISVLPQRWICDDYVVFFMDRIAIMVVFSFCSFCDDVDFAMMVVFILAKFNIILVWQYC